MPQENSIPKILTSDNLKNGVNKLFQITQGRHTAFTMAFFIIGNVMHWYHRLDGTYITFMGTLMGFVLGHSVQENHFNKQG